MPGVLSEGTEHPRHKKEGEKDQPHATVERREHLSRLQWPDSFDSSCGHADECRETVRR
jgi:hypothetical protein